MKITVYLIVHRTCVCVSHIKSIEKYDKIAFSIMHIRYNVNVFISMQFISLFNSIAIFITIAQYIHHVRDQREREIFTQ